MPAALLKDSAPRLRIAMATGAHEPWTICTAGESKATVMSDWLMRHGTQPPIGGPEIVCKSAIGNVDARVIFAAFLIAHVVAWTLYGTIALGIGGIHGDMAEAWVWGQELQLGYFKHPPFWAWLTFAWFEILPRANWSFYLLASLNAAAGLGAVWALAALFLKDAERLAVVLFLMLTPIYGFLALKFNANSILLSLWPWTTFFFVRSLASRRGLDSVALGLFAGLGMLSKYYTLLLLATLFFAALLSGCGRRYFRSPSPYVAAATCALVLLPHVWWVIESGNSPLEYAASRFQFARRQVLGWALETTTAPVVFCGAALVILFVALRLSPATAARKLAQWAATPANIWISVLTFLPFLLTLSFGFIGHSKITISYTIPIFYMLPILIFSALGPRLTEHGFRIIATSAALFLLVIAVGSPAIAYARFKLEAESALEPRMEVAEEAASLWHTKMKGRLKVVAGTKIYAESISFYSADSPSQFIDFSYRDAPWITLDRIEREGLLIVCASTDVTCLSRSRAFMTASSTQYTQRVAKVLYGETASGYEFTFTLIPPRGMDRKL